MPSNKNTILIADDDKEIRELISILLQAEGYETLLASNGKEAIEKIDSRINLYILDIMMPYFSGIDVCKEIRKHSTAPVLFVTAKGEENDKKIGFSAGGDDYIVKPFTPNELLMRVQALLRRHQVYDNVQSSDVNPSQIELRKLRVCVDKSEVFIDNQQVKLTPTEFNILLLLLKNKGKVFSAQEIYERLWEEDYYYQTQNTIMVHIRKLREKIEKDPHTPEYVKTVWGRGYKIE